MSFLVKYPRTYHLPWSPGATSDDKVLKSTSHFDGKEIVVTEKMDGENTTLYNDYFHARSVNAKYHLSQDWVRALHGKIAHEIPKGWRICGENLYAKHSIHYKNLSNYFMVFSIWDENNSALSWVDTVEWSNGLGLSTVPILYQGNWDETFVKAIKVEEGTVEGYVVRIASGFEYDEFKDNVAKYVRPNHVQTDKHWKHGQIIQNKLNG